MEFIGQWLATVCSSVFGTVFMIYLIALAFDWMSNNKSLSMSRGVVNFSMKLIGVLGKLLLTISIPLFRDVGEKILYVSSYYIEKNKQKQSNINAAPYIPPVIPPAGKGEPDLHNANNEPVAQADTELSSKAASNPYDEPPEPEIIQ